MQINDSLGDIYIQGHQRVVGIIVEIRNSLSFPVRIDLIEFNIQHAGIILAYNVSIPIRKKIKEHANEQFSLVFDLPQGHGLEKHPDNSTVKLTMEGNIVFFAINKNFSKAINVPVVSYVHHSHY